MPFEWVSDWLASASSPKRRSAAAIAAVGQLDDVVAIGRGGKAEERIGSKGIVILREGASRRIEHFQA